MRAGYGRCVLAEFAVNAPSTVESSCARKPALKKAGGPPVPARKLAFKEGVVQQTFGQEQGRFAVHGGPTVGE